MSSENTPQNAPFAYPNAALGLIHQYRARALPELITPSSLRPFGISQRPRRYARRLDFWA